MNFSRLVRVGFGFIDKFEIYPSDPDNIVMVQFLAFYRPVIHKGSVRTPQIPDVIFKFRPAIRNFQFLDYGVGGAYHGIVYKNVALRTAADAQFWFVDRAFVDCHPVMQLYDECHMLSPYKLALRNLYNYAFGHLATWV
jgi:hypothetical protein